MAGSSATARRAARIASGVSHALTRISARLPCASASESSSCDGLPSVARSRASSRSRDGLVLGSGRLVRRELRGGETGPRERVARIDGDGALEVGDRARQLAHVERLDAQPAFHHGAVGFEARRLAAARRRPCPALRAEAELAGELRRHLVLQREDLVEPAVDLGVGDGLAADDVHDARGDADALAVALEAADDDQPHAQRRRDVVHRAAGPPRRFGHAPAVDDAEAPERAQIAADGFGDAGREPRRLGVAGDVGEVEHGDGRSSALAGSAIGRAASARVAPARGVDRRDEAIAAARDGLDVSADRRHRRRAPARSSDTACASALSVTLAPGHSASSSASLVTSVPAWSRRWSSRSSSLGVRSSGRPSSSTR